MPERVRTFRPQRLAAARREEHGDPFYATKQWRAVRAAVLVRDEYRCGYCGKFLYGVDATVDHIIERQDGGQEFDPANLRASCRTCNSRKGARRQHQHRKAL